MPVTPKTPGAIAATGITLSSIASGITAFKCLVTIIPSTTFGPKASGVTCQFPRPTTNAVSFSFIPARFFKVTPSTFETPSISSPS